MSIGEKKAEGGIRTGKWVASDGYTSNNNPTGNRSKMSIGPLLFLLSMMSSIFGQADTIKCNQKFEIEVTGAPKQTVTAGERECPAGIDTCAKVKCTCADGKLTAKIEYEGCDEYEAGKKLSSDWPKGGADGLPEGCECSSFAFGTSVGGIGLAFSILIVFIAHDLRGFV